MEYPCPHREQQPLAMLPRGRAGRALGAHWLARPPGKWDRIPKAERLRQDGLWGGDGAQSTPKMHLPGRSWVFLGPCAGRGSSGIIQLSRSLKGFGRHRFSSKRVFRHQFS